MGHRDFESVCKRLADDLVQMHKDTGIELEYWENGRLFVEHYYRVHSKVEIGYEYKPDRIKEFRERGY